MRAWVSIGAPTVPQNGDPAHVQSVHALHALAHEAQVDMWIMAAGRPGSGALIALKFASIEECDEFVAVVQSAREKLREKLAPKDAQKTSFCP